jgi:hypothetical protein
MFELKIRLERLKFQTAEIMVLMVHSRIYDILFKSILVLIPKHHLILMCFSPIKKIYKNI